MTPNHARMLAVEIVDSWQDNNIREDIWVAELDPLDYQLAYATISRMRQELTRPPSVATFKSTYLAIARAHEPDPIQSLRDTNAISRDDYIAELARRSKFSPDAQLELERWERLASRRRHPSSGDTPAVIGPS